MKARPRLRHLPAIGLVLVMAGFLLGPATPASADHCDPGEVHGLDGEIVICVPAEVPPIDPCAVVEDLPGILRLLLLDCPEIEKIFNLGVAKAGTGAGTVTSTDGLVGCGPDCGQSYGVPTQVTLVATPGPNSSFAGWNVLGSATILGGCDGTGPCTLVVNWDNLFNGNTLVTATFNAVGTVAAASVTRVSHLHQHGGIVTGPWHHGVRHLKKHTHTHSHPAI
jgi:hypothetical protein